MATPAPITVENLLKNGVHFGHKTRRWNPKMKPYLYGKRGEAHVIDLTKTIAAMREAFAFIKTLIDHDRLVLFVGTKKQARSILAEQAQRCGMPYINARWLGGTFTNFETIKKSIQRLKRLEARKASEDYQKLTKKEQTMLDKQLDKLLVNLAGIRDMIRIPDALFVVDTNRDYIAVQEATRIGIPVIALVDSNSDPEAITYPIPANDDAIKSLQFLISSFADFILAAKAEKQKTTPPPEAAKE